MKISISQTALAKCLAIVGRAVNSKNTMPILSNILLEAKHGRLRLSATNREIGINCWLSATVEEDGAITIPAKLLADFINSLPPEPVFMELTERTQTMHLRCSRFTANMKGIDAAEFPLLPTMEAGPDAGDKDAAPVAEGVHVAIETDGLRKMIDQVVIAASGDQNRPTLTGVEVVFEGDYLSMAATDGYRLALRRVPLAEAMTEEKIVVIVPARSLSELARMSADGDDAHPVNVLVAKNRNQVLFQIMGKGGTFERVELVCELIDARFPDYRATVPKSWTTRTVVDTASLLKAARVANLFARDNAGSIRFALMPDESPGKIRLSASSAEMGDNVSDVVAEIEGERLDIVFNAVYLIDALSQIDQPQIVIETTQPTRPGSMRPAGMSELDYLHVIMPMSPPR